MGFPTEFSIALSPDYKTWTTVIAKTGYPNPGGAPQGFSFPAMQARYISVGATKLTADQYGKYYFQLAQIEAYGGNLALGRPVTALSSYESVSEGWGAVAAYSAIVWAMYKSMVKNFDMTIRKQSR